MTLPPEARLIWLTAGPQSNDGPIRSLLEEEIDWEILFGMAVLEHAVPAVWDRLRRIGFEPVPIPVAQRFQHFTQVSHFRQLHLEHRLGETVEVLRGGGIKVLLLKGAGLSLTAYPAFWARPMMDLDLLVHRDEVERAVELVSRVRWAGPDRGPAESFYAQHHHLPPMEDGDGTHFSLELHTDVLSSGHRFGLTPEALWREAVPAPLPGAWVASPVHQLLHLALHFAWSHVMSTGGWKTFRDTEVLLNTSSIDWDAFAREAERSRAGTVSFWTLRLARDLCAIQVTRRRVGTSASQRIGSARTVPEAALRRGGIRLWIRVPVGTPAEVDVDDRNPTRAEWPRLRAAMG